MIITLYDFYKNYYEENRLNFKPDASIYVSMMNHIENCPDEKKTEHIKFIDGELCRYAVKNTDALNAILNKWKKYMKSIIRQQDITYMSLLSKRYAKAIHLRMC